MIPIPRNKFIKSFYKTKQKNKFKSFILLSADSQPGMLVSIHMSLPLFCLCPQA